MGFVSKKKRKENNFKFKEYSQRRI